MRLYRPKSDYIQYLFDRDKRIINSENTIGVPIRLNELIYFLPIDSPSVSDYEDGVLKKSSPTIMRMFDLKTKIYLGKCLFSNMFSVPYKELEVVNITDFDEEKFVFVEKKLEYIKRNHDRIMKSAKMLFKQKSRKL
ncbi:type III toxin-antitoxin system ToxN/AbiQ family toxin [Thomasclavelia cocleata]|uniref:type III toxin-antitoxin system ToxN/AbiQ family toxin n=1 Tax=Thomasclavelia cocleata TaxID=69824 RepID=UPI0024311BED|nr:type III toxin-antitoxin system ToxN/AbiQ family toxin [Thomasclavelia cocleata]